MTARGVLRVLYGALVDAGRMYVWMPGPDEDLELVGPPPRHPERLRPDVPPAEAEPAPNHRPTGRDRAFEASRRTGPARGRDARG